MRIFLVIATGLLIAQFGFTQDGAPAPQGGGRGGRGGGRGGAAEAVPPPKPGFECFEHAETPDFPHAALQENVDGTVWATFDLTAQGTPDKLQTQVTSAWASATKLLVP